MTSLRVFFIGGLLSYRALFAWLTPWILIPTFLIQPVLQICLFAWVGREAGIGNDQFFLIGNAVLGGAIPCLFAMGNTIGNERYFATLPLLLVTPVRRLPLFLGRAMPVVVNGLWVTLFALVAGSLVLHVSIAPSVWAPLVVVIASCAFGCTGLGLFNAALALRVRETAVLSNIMLGVLIIVSGANVPLDQLPSWLASIGRCLPLTHGIEAANGLADGQSWSQVSGLVGAEVLVGAVWAGLGLGLLAWLERESHRHGTLETA